MSTLKYLPLVFKQVVRQRTRTALTVCGIGSAMFLFCSIQALQSGIHAATRARAGENTLIVYRENRFCPFTSRLPENYQTQIQKIPGVKSVVPMMIVVSNCRTSLDVVTFRGVPPEIFARDYAPQLKLIAGSVDDWSRRSDAVLLGETLASRRGLKIGDRFDANGVTVSVAAIAASEQAQDQNVGYVHLDFLQRAPGIKKVGVVTQFAVKVDDPAKLKNVAELIDGEFRTAQAPTMTRSETAFIARAADDLLEMIHFTRWLALGCIAAVFALVANTVVLSVQDRVKEHAVLQTLGYSRALIALLIMLEGLVLSLLGGGLGTIAAALVLNYGKFSITSEGVSINVSTGLEIWLSGLVVSCLLGIGAGLVPALQASRREIAAAFRAV